MTLILRPGVTHPRFWNPDRPPRSEWNRTRKIVLERDDWTCAGCQHRALKLMQVHHLEDSGDSSPVNLVPLCIACHCILHVGRSLKYGMVEIWRSEVSQIEIVQRSREGIKQGLTLATIKSQLPLTLGKYPADSMDYPNDLVRKMGAKPRAYLAKPLCAVFVDMNRWQIEEKKKKVA